MNSAKEGKKRRVKIRQKVNRAKPYTQQQRLSNDGKRHRATKKLTVVLGNPDLYIVTYTSQLRQRIVRRVYTPGGVNTPGGVSIRLQAYMSIEVGRTADAISGRILTANWGELGQLG